MDAEEFRDWALKAANWGVDYRKTVSERPVRSPMQPSELIAALPGEPPEVGVPFEELFSDFERLIPHGLTHWQHPRFFAYFPSNAAPPSVIAEILTAAISAQCMIWQTSPAATELETVMLRWLVTAFGLPNEFDGVVHDTASTATLVAVLTMRERALQWRGNQEGLSGQQRCRIYASDLVHSSIDRAIWISGIGQENLVRIPTDGPHNSLNPQALREAIETDLGAGFLPAGVILCVGGTSFGASDQITAACEVAQEYGLYVHVDAAWAGSAMICPEFRLLWQGIELVDSIVINPHKWLGIQFDCSTHFFRDASPILKTLAIHPDYLQTYDKAGVRDYCEYTIPLGRRFRALKMWFVLRYYGLEGLRTRIRNHVAWSQVLVEELRQSPLIEICTPPFLSLFTFRLLDQSLSEEGLNLLNLEFLRRVNDEGLIYLSPTKIDGRQVIRFQIGQFDCSEADVKLAKDCILRLAAECVGH